MATSPLLKRSQIYTRSISPTFRRRMNNGGDDYRKNIFRKGKSELDLRKISNSKESIEYIAKKPEVSSKEVARDRSSSSPLPHKLFGTFPDEDHKTDDLDEGKNPAYWKNLRERLRLCQPASIVTSSDLDEITQLRTLALSQISPKPIRKNEFSSTAQNINKYKYDARLDHACKYDINHLVPNSPRINKKSRKKTSLDSNDITNISNVTIKVTNFENENKQHHKEIDMYLNQNDIKPTSPRIPQHKHKQMSPLTLETQKQQHFLKLPSIQCLSLPKTPLCSPSTKSNSIAKNSDVRCSLHFDQAFTQSKMI